MSLRPEVVSHCLKNCSPNLESRQSSPNYHGNDKEPTSTMVSCICSEESELTTLPAHESQPPCLAITSIPSTLGGSMGVVPVTMGQTDNLSSCPVRSLPIYSSLLLATPHEMRLLPKVGMISEHGLHIEDSSTSSDMVENLSTSFGLNTDVSSHLTPPAMETLPCPGSQPPTAVKVNEVLVESFPASESWDNSSSIRANLAICLPGSMTPPQSPSSFTCLGPGGSSLVNTSFPVLPSAAKDASYLGDENQPTTTPKPSQLSVSSNSSDLSVTTSNRNSHLSSFFILSAVKKLRPRARSEVQVGRTFPLFSWSRGSEDKDTIRGKELSPLPEKDSKVDELKAGESDKKMARTPKAESERHSSIGSGCQTSTRRAAMSIIRSHSEISEPIVDVALCSPTSSRRPGKDEERSFVPNWRSRAEGRTRDKLSSRIRILSRSVSMNDVPSTLDDPKGYGENCTHGRVHRNSWGQPQLSSPHDLGQPGRSKTYNRNRGWLKKMMRKLSFRGSRSQKPAWSISDHLALPPVSAELCDQSELCLSCRGSVSRNTTTSLPVFALHATSRSNDANNQSSSTLLERHIVNPRALNYTGYNEHKPTGSGLAFRSPAVQSITSLETLEEDEWTRSDSPALELAALPLPPHRPPSSSTGVSSQPAVEMEGLSESDSSSPIIPVFSVANVVNSFGCHEPQTALETSATLSKKSLDPTSSFTAVSPPVGPPPKRPNSKSKYLGDSSDLPLQDMSNMSPRQQMCSTRGYSELPVLQSTKKSTNIDDSKAPDPKTYLTSAGPSLNSMIVFRPGTANTFGGLERVALDLRRTADSLETLSGLSLKPTSSNTSSTSTEIPDRW